MAPFVQICTQRLRADCPHLTRVRVPKCLCVCVCVLICGRLRPISVRISSCEFALFRCCFASIHATHGWRAVFTLSLCVYMSRSSLMHCRPYALLCYCPFAVWPSLPSLYVNPCGPVGNQLKTHKRSKRGLKRTNGPIYTSSIGRHIGRICAECQ